MILDYNMAIDKKGEINFENIMGTMCLPLPMATLFRMCKDNPVYKEKFELAF